LQRWKKADTWDDVAHNIRRGHVWCIRINHKIFSLLAHHYRRLVQVLDYRRIIPLLAFWSDEMVFNTGCSLDVIFFTDGKPWKTARPGHGATAQALVAAGRNDINLMQRAYNNGHYGFVEQRFSMFYRLMGCVTHLFVLYIDMMHLCCEAAQ
jgi:hypothetical protein